MPDSIKLNQFLIPLLLLALLVVLSYTNITFFHTVAEFFSIIVAYIMFVVAWQTFPFTRNHFLMFLGLVYFWIASLDLMHTLTFKGVYIFSDMLPNISIQFWVAGRLLEAVCFLVAPVFLSRSINRYYLASILATFSLLASYLILTGRFPDMYIEGKGLTSLKVYAEYLCIGLIVLSIVFLWTRRELLQRHVLQLILAALVVSVLTELTLTLYSNVHSATLVIGHLLKFISFWLVFRAIIRTTLTEPYKVMARDSSTYDAIAYPVFVVDNNGIIHQVNAATMSFLNLTAKDVIGQHCHYLFHDRTINEEDCNICRSIKQGQLLKPYVLEIPVQKHWHEISLSPVKSNNHFNGMVQTVKDVTEGEQTKLALVRSEQQFRQLTDNINQVFWMMDPIHNKLLYVSPAYESIWGQTLYSRYNDPQSYLQNIHEEDINNVKQALKKQVNGNYDEEYRVVKPDGSIVWVRDRSFPIKNENGEVYRIAGITEDITQQIEAVDARRANEAKSRFLSRMSHELRTPMNAVLGFAQLLQIEPDNLYREQKENIEEIIKAGHHLMELINEVLELSRIESGKLQLSFETINLSDLLDECIDIVKPAAASSSITLQVKHDFNGFEITSDRLRLKQIILNLLSNAIKYNSEHGIVVLSGEIVGKDTVQISVQDTGPGISKADQERLFIPFERLDQTSHIEGTGIGLALSLHLARNLGGNIDVYSEQGAGSFFWLTVPIHQKQDS